jgi:ABC-2 type transport system permease protein
MELTSGSVEFGAHEAGERTSTPTSEQAGSLIFQTHRQASQLLSPWQGFGVLCLWTAALLIAAAYLRRRRDA